MEMKTPPPPPLLISSRGKGLTRGIQEEERCSGEHQVDLGGPFRNGRGRASQWEEGTGSPGRQGEGEEVVAYSVRTQIIVDLVMCAKGSC